MIRAVLSPAPAARGSEVHAPCRALTFGPPLLMALAARDLSGPAEMVLTRMPYFWPASHASVRVSLSSCDLAEDMPPP